MRFSIIEGEKKENKIQGKEKENKINLACCSILFSLAKPTRKHRHQEKVVEKS